MPPPRNAALSLVATATLLLLIEPACRGAGATGPDASSPVTGAVAALQDAAEPGDGIDAGTEPMDTAVVRPHADAGPAGPQEDGGALAQALSATVRALCDDAEPRALVRGGANEEIALQSRFEVELPRLADFRVRLLDEADRAVASTDRAQIAERSRYQLVPSEPLTPGSRYALVIDGLRADLATDDRGRAFERLRVELKTRGEKPPSAKRAKSGKSGKSGKPGKPGRRGKPEASSEPSP
jgi:hypothetical protein